MQDWQQMSQAQLDTAYANADYIADAGAFPVRWAAEAAVFRATANSMLDIPYDAADGARLDLFRPVNPARGLVVFVHGGYWRRFGKSDWSHFAAGALAADHAVAMVGYPLAPLVRISDITRYVAKAVDCAAAHVEGPIRLTGHSAGGHLVARMLMPDAAPACSDRIATCVPISPVADLRPLVPQSLNVDWRLDEVEAASESPVLGRKQSQARVAVHVGGDERPSFLWQARALSDAWRAPLRIDRRKHHFDVIDDLMNPASDLMADILA